MVAYGGMAAMAAHGLFFSEGKCDQADRQFRTAVLTGGAVMASCSAYLM